MNTEMVQVSMLEAFLRKRENTEESAEKDSDDDENRKRRNMQVCRYKRRVIREPNEALLAEKLSSLSQKPERVHEIVSEVGSELKFRWECEKLLRGYAAFIGLFRGVTIHQTSTQLTMWCS